MPFRLDLLRHGEALPPGKDGDAGRPLSAMGRRDVARVAEEYVRRGWRPSRVVMSPLRRAQETADILLSRLGREVEAETMRVLVPDHVPNDVVEALQRGRETDYVLAVGHQPLLGQLAILLTGEREQAFPPAAMVRIEFPDSLAVNAGRIVERVLPETLP